MKILALATILLPTGLTFGQTIFNVGDSRTIQSQEFLREIIPTTITSQRNAQDSSFTAENIVDWMNDPYGNGNGAPTTYDIVRWNNGVWDSYFQPTLPDVNSTTPQDYAANLTSIVNSIRTHSPNALIIFSTSPLMDFINFGDDEPPHNWLKTADYNSFLESYRDVALDTLPQLGVYVDDKFSFYRDHTPSDFGLSPDHEWTGEAWHFDRIHLDPAYSRFEAQQTATAIWKAIAESGDFDFDGVLTAADIDLLSDAIVSQSKDPQFDVNNDGVVSHDDHSRWVNETRMTWFGDANLDGEFDSQDLVAVLQFGKFEDDIERNSSWSDGDWDGDREFTSNDFIRALQAGGFGQGRRTAFAVPEPNLSAPFLLGFCILFGRPIFRSIPRPN